MTELKKCVTGFIEDIWNNSRFEMLSEYLHPAFVDHSLPSGLQNARGLHTFLLQLGKKMNHYTVIEKIVTENDFVILKVKTTLLSFPHAPGTPSNVEVLRGYRILAFAEQRIIGHWEFFHSDATDDSDSMLSD